MITWDGSTGVLVASDGDTIVARVLKDGCEWLAVGRVPPSTSKQRQEVIDYVERQWANRPDAEPGPVGEGAGVAG